MNENKLPKTQMILQKIIMPILFGTICLWCEIILYSLMTIQMRVCFRNHHIISIVSKNSQLFNFSV